MFKEKFFSNISKLYCMILLNYKSYYYYKLDFDSRQKFGYKTCILHVYMYKIKFTIECITLLQILNKFLLNIKEQFFSKNHIINVWHIIGFFIIVSIK